MPAIKFPAGMKYDAKARFTATRLLAEDGSPRQSGDSFFMRVKVK